MDIFDIRRRDVLSFDKFVDISVDSKTYVEAREARDEKGNDVREDKEKLKGYQREIERNPNFSHPVYDPTYKAMTHDKVYKQSKDKEPFDYKSWPELDRGYPVVVANDEPIETTNEKAKVSLKDFVGSIKEVADIHDKVKEEKERGDKKQKEYFVKEERSHALTSMDEFLNYDEESEVNEKSKSKAQQRLMGQAYAYKTGKLKKADMNPKYADQIVKLAQGMSEDDLEDFAKTKHKGLKEKK